MTVKLATACDFRALDAVGNPVFVIRRDVNGADHMIHLNASYRDIVGEQANAMLGPVAEVFPARLADSLRRNCTDALNSPRRSSLMNSWPSLESKGGGAPH